MSPPFTKLLEVHKLIDQGNRDEQQDALRDVVQESHALFVLADGMGGHSGGAIASRVVTATIAEKLTSTLEGSPPALDLNVTQRRGPKADGHWQLFHLFDQGAEALQKVRAENPHLDPRTTCVAALFQGDEIHVASAGDSRCFIVRANGEIWHTDDHSIARILVVTGEITDEEAQHHPDRNKLYRSLTDGGADADYYTHPALQDGDAMILCSDGFWEHLLDEELRQVAAEKDLNGMLKEYTERILQRAGTRADNLSALVVRIRNAHAGFTQSPVEESAPRSFVKQVQDRSTDDETATQTNTQTPAVSIDHQIRPQHRKQKNPLITAGILLLIATVVFLALRPSTSKQSNPDRQAIEPVELSPPTNLAPNETETTREETASGPQTGGPDGIIE